MMPEEKMDDMVRALREEYNVPPETPREEMWGAIEAGLGPRPNVVSMDDARRRLRPAWHRPAAWAAAAAAVLVVGVGIGRVTAPVAVPVASVPAARDGSDTEARAALESL